MSGAPGTVRALPGRAGLGMITADPRAGGVAYVAQLLREALARILGAPPYEVSLDHTAIDAVPRSTAALYSARLLGRLLGLPVPGGPGRPEWWVFDHVASAQPAALLPPGIRPSYGVFIHDVDGWGATMAARRRLTFQRASVRIANSHYTARRTEAAHPEIGPVAGCPLGLLPAAPGAARQPLAYDRADIGHDVLILGRISSATRYKGHDLLIESWSDIRRSVPDARLLVAGDGDDVPRLRRLAADRGVAEHVAFLGFVPEEELERLLHRIAVLAMPSTSEGFGLAWLRAMRAGAPCVAVSAAAAPEVIVHGETGLLCDPGDGAGVVAAIVRLLGDDALRRAMGRASHERWASGFTFEHFVHRLERVLQPLIDGGR